MARPAKSDVGHRATVAAAEAGMPGGARTGRNAGAVVLVVLIWRGDGLAR
jgi:hypothetical protein